MAMRRILTANGDYYIFCAPNGALTGEAVELLRTAARCGADFLYADEALRTADGAPRVCAKPGPSPDTLLSYNYIGSPVAVSAALIERAGPPASDSAAERWAFVMRAFFNADYVLHIPRVLFDGVEEAARADPALVKQQLKRLRRSGDVHPARARGFVTVRYTCPPGTLLSVVIAAQGRAEDVRDTLDSLELWNTETRQEYIVMDGGAPSEGAEAYYRALEQCGVSVYRRWYEPNLPRLFNLGAEQANGDALLFLRAGDRVACADALKRMLEFAMQPHIGAVCAFAEKPPAAEAYVQNVRQIPRAPMLARDKFVKSGGFDESLPREGGEAALSLRLREQRLQLVKTPDALIVPAASGAQPGERNARRCRDLSI